MVTPLSQLALLSCSVSPNKAEMMLDFPHPGGPSTKTLMFYILKTTGKNWAKLSMSVQVSFMIGVIPKRTLRFTLEIKKKPGKSSPKQILVNRKLEDNCFFLICALLSMRQIQSGGKINKNRLWSDVKFSYGNSFQFKMPLTMRKTVRGLGKYVRGLDRIPGHVVQAKSIRRKDATDKENFS